MNSQDLRNLQEAYLDVYRELDEGRGWRDNRRQNIPNNLAVNSVGRHLEKSGKTRKPTPTNLARRELKARELEKKSKDLETRDRTNAERWFAATVYNPHSRTDNSSTSSRLRSRAKAIRAVSKSQTRRTADDEDNQRIANSVSSYTKNQFDDNGPDGRKNKFAWGVPKTNFDKSTSHLDLSRVDPDSYGTKRKTKKKPDPKSSNDTTITKKAPTPQNKIVKFQREEVDLYDIILSHLLDEGYADTNESALAIMGNMSEDWRESIVEKFSMAADSSKPQSPKRTKLPKSREEKIGSHDDWKDTPTEWGELPPAAKKLRSRAITVTGTQRRQDTETGVR